MQKLRKGLSMFTNRGLALGFAGWLHCVSLSHSQDEDRRDEAALSYFTNRS